MSDSESEEARNVYLVAGLELKISILRGRDLVAKDRNFMGRKSTSDPFVKMYCGGKFCGKTKTKAKTLAPVWKEGFKVTLGAENASKIISGEGSSQAELQFHIYDEDKMTGDDPMGVVRVPLPSAVRVKPESKWYKVGKGSGSNYCKNATGELEIKIQADAKKILRVISGNSQTLTCKKLRIGLSWDLEQGQAIDLDSSCVAIDALGNILLEESVYYGNLQNSNSSIVHSGDVRDGNEIGDDEVITCELNQIHMKVRALYFILTIATPEKNFRNVRSAGVTVTDIDTGFGLCNFQPALSGPHSAMFLVRISREGNTKWTMTVIEETDPVGRDFGSLIPEIKGYSRDIVPNLKIKPKERIAVMRKGGNIRLRDYSFPSSPFPERLRFGLAWDVTDGTNIDLDASVICLNSSYEPIDYVFFKKLRSNDGAIIHSGDEREGDETGDDEKIDLFLNNVDKNIEYIVFTITSYSGQQLDDVSKASCHLYDANTQNELATYALSNSSILDGYTGFVVACLYRKDGDWCMRIISLPAVGKVAVQLVEPTVNYLKNTPPPPVAVVPEPEIVLTQMPPPTPIDEEIVLEPMIPAYKIANPNNAPVDEEIVL